MCQQGRTITAADPQSTSCLVWTRALSARLGYSNFRPWLMKSLLASDFAVVRLFEIQEFHLRTKSNSIRIRKICPCWVKFSHKLHSWWYPPINSTSAHKHTYTHTHTHTLNLHLLTTSKKYSLLYIGMYLQQWFVRDQGSRATLPSWPPFLSLYLHAFLHTAALACCTPNQIDFED